VTTAGALNALPPMAAAETAAAVAADRSPVMPFRSKSQCEVSQMMVPSRAAVGGPLGAWSGRQATRQAGQQSMSGGSGSGSAATTSTAVMAFPHSVHFADDCNSSSRLRDVGSIVESSSGGRAYAAAAAAAVVADDDDDDGGGLPGSGASSSRHLQLVGGGGGGLG
ncbi:hypothetical protein Vretifemale_7209, partial [Volvox reticuliferus]